jgi:hypothetical protein
LHIKDLEPKDPSSCCCPRQKMGWWQKLCPRQLFFYDSAIH